MATLPQVISTRRSTKSFHGFLLLKFPWGDVVVHQLHDGDYVGEAVIFQVADSFQGFIESFFADFYCFLNRVVYLILKNTEIQTYSQP